MNVTSKSMRDFATGCLRWAAASKDPNRCHSILREALFWTRVADAIDNHVADERAVVLPDLRSKLN
jgi:hypothetical protein